MTAWTRTKTNRAGKVGNRPTVDSVCCSWSYCEHGDPDWLEGRGETSAEISEDAARLDAFNRGDWHMEGCRAVAIVSYPIDARGNRRLQEFSSGGPWGIESDSSETYRREVEKDELEDLKAHLEAFGIDTSGLKE